VLSLQMNGENVKNGNRRWQSTGGGNQLAVAINWRWQPTSGGNQPAVTVETVLPLATLQCGAVSNDRAESSDVEALVLSLQSGKVLLAAQLTILRLGIRRFNKKNTLTLTAVQFESNDSGRIKKGNSNMYDMQQSRCSNISNAVVPGSKW